MQKTLFRLQNNDLQKTLFRQIVIQLNGSLSIFPISKLAGVHKGPKSEHSARTRLAIKIEKPANSTNDDKRR